MKLEEGYAWIREGAGVINGFAAGVVTNMTVKGLVSNLVEDSIDNPIVSMGVKARSASCTRQQEKCLTVDFTPQLKP